MDVHACGPVENRHESFYFVNENSMVTMTTSAPDWTKITALHVSISAASALDRCPEPEEPSKLPTNETRR